MRKVQEKLTNAVGQLEWSQAHLSPPDTEVESPARTRAKRPPTRRTLHFSRGESSRSRIDEVRSKDSPTRRTNSAEPKLSALKRRIAELEAKNKGGTEDYLTKRHSPFTEDVLIEPLLEKLKILQMATYEGDGDLLSHLDKYTSWMELQGTSDVIMCRVFSLTLGDKARRWFRRLHQRLVKNWNDLATTFLAQFMGSKDRTTPKERLVSIKQGKSEPLKGHLSRFNKQSMEVEKISDDDALMSVLAALRPRMRLWWLVHEDGPKTYHEFLSRVEKYISAENASSD
ncbi:uncharacterized protein LOC111400263 [Olea europaea var. sylvestris]|uniref:uncharacterized protein LOC111400263 n=1 Tax=Olea europaea var. sylvestris TaxID=158386 RepID=UPI000C1CFAE5|nr:uncharacterized protein LOC111400263 [Olea europaea var. sylvestris]